MTNRKAIDPRAVVIGERIVGVCLLLVPLALRVVEKPAMPAWGQGNSIGYHLTAIVSLIFVLKLAITRLTRQLRGSDGGRILGFVVVLFASLLPIFHYLLWSVGLYAWLMFIPYSLLAASFLKLPAARDPFA